MIQFRSLHHTPRYRIKEISEASALIATRPPGPGAQDRGLINHHPLPLQERIRPN